VIRRKAIENNNNNNSRVVLTKNTNRKEKKGKHIIALLWLSFFPHPSHQAFFSCHNSFSLSKSFLFFFFFCFVCFYFLTSFDVIVFSDL